MPSPAQNGTSNNGSEHPERALTVEDLIAEADELRSVLHDASSRLSHLISGLKQHRRKSRAVQAAVQSLRQIRLDG